MRLFAAVDVSGATRETLAAEQVRIGAALGGSGGTVRWIRSDRVHLTLVFVGDVDAARVPSLIEGVRADVNTAPFEISVSGIGVFSARGAPRVLWIGIGAGADKVKDLRQELAARIAALGIRLERRDFHPHLTLGRWTSSKPSDRARLLAAAQPGALARDRVTRVTWYESRLSASGADYIALTHANLTGR
ncbi:MAG: RNA 2',3'-cyclic phosphodiesterase [Vicinamibacterales bacterium]